MSGISIGVVGCGVVGRATAKVWDDFGFEVLIHDKEPSRSEYELSALMEEADIVMVCLPTPYQEMNSDGEALHDFFSSITGCRKPIALRSTVEPGTTSALSNWHNLPGLFHYPEFLDARTALADTASPFRHVLGHLDNLTSRGAVEQMRDLLSMCFEESKVHVMTAAQSEITKLACNLFFSAKNAVFGAVWSLAHKHMEDYEPIREAVAADPRIGSVHTYVPGREGLLGAGGACLPKDMKTFADIARQHLNKNDKLCQFLDSLVNLHEYWRGTA